MEADGQPDDNARTLRPVEGGEWTEGATASPEGQAAEGGPRGSGADAGGPTPPAEGGSPSNTHPQSSQVKLSGYPEYQAAGGIDWLEGGAFVQWELHAFLTLMDQLAEAKLAAQQGGEKWLDTTAGPLRVHSTGFKRGGERGRHFDFKLEYFGVQVGLANREAPGADEANLCMCQRGRACLLLGAREAHARVGEFVARLGGVVAREKLTRVDLCLDVAQLDVGELQRLVDRDQFVTRAKRGKGHRDLMEHRGTGFTIGSHPARLVVYDKMAEQLGTHDALYLQALVERRWGGTLPEKATRIEFQLGRRWLTKHGIDSPADIFERAGTVLDKLAGEWFRITDEPVDRENKHQSRAATHPLWQAIHGAFLAVFGQPTGQLFPLLRARVSPDRLVKQGVGCFSRAMLQRGLPVDPPAKYVDSVRQLIQATYSKSEWLALARRLEYRRTEYRG